MQRATQGLHLGVCAHREAVKLNTDRLDGVNKIWSRSRVRARDPHQERDPLETGLDSRSQLGDLGID